MKLPASISAALTALGLLNSYAAASPLPERFTPATFDKEAGAVNWQIQGYTKTVWYEICDKYTIEEKDGEPIVHLQSEGSVKRHYPVTYYIARVKDTRPEGCTAGWTLKVLGEGNEAASSWVSLLPWCKDWSTGEPSEAQIEERRWDGVPEMTWVGEKKETLFRHPECQDWEVEQTEDATFRPKCGEWKFHKGGDYNYRHQIFYEEVALYGQECMDWGVDVDTRRVGKHHDRTIAMPFCYDPGAVNAIFPEDGAIDTAFRALSEDA